LLKKAKALKTNPSSKTNMARLRKFVAYRRLDNAYTRKS